MCVCGGVGGDSDGICARCAFLGNLYIFEKEAEELFVNYM